MHPHVLIAFDRTAVFHSREETPAVQRLQQDLVEPRILRWLDQLDFERTVCVYLEVRDGHDLITLLAQIVGQDRHGL